MTDRIRHDPDHGLLLAGDATLPVMTWESHTGEWFVVRRALVAFENNWALSVIWGSATWSSNRHSAYGGGGFQEEPTSVEVAVFGPDGGWFIPDPFEYVTADQLARLAKLVAGLPSPLDRPDVDEDAIRLLILMEVAT